MSGRKYRPALLLGYADRGDWIACQITSNPFSDMRAVEILDSGFASGGLRRASYARPGKLFTANETIFANSLGELESDLFEHILDSVIRILSS